MKLLSIILSFVVFSISIIPCCNDDDCIDEIKTKQSHTEHDGQNHDNDCEGCSPFITCGSCSGFYLSIIDYNIRSTASIQQIFIPFQHNFDENYLAKIWQPPKLS